VISSYKALSTPLDVNSLETLLFLTLLNDTHVRQEETNDDRRKSIHSTEYIIQFRVRKFGNRSDAEAVRCHGRSCIRTKGTPKSDFISGAKVTAAHERILNRNLGGIALHPKHVVIVVAFVERGKPNVRADEEDRDAIDEEQPVEHDEGPLSTYGDEYNGTDKGCQEYDSQDSSTSEDNGAKRQVEEQVGLSPDDRENEGDDSCCQEADNKERPGKHETLGHHVGGANG